MSGGVSFVGAGPGAADLMTVRGARRVGEADVVLWAPSVVGPTWIRENTRADAELVDISRCTEEDVHALYRRAAAEKLRVVRLHAGDPATWGDLRRHVDACGRLGLAVDVVAGVSAVSAAAVSLGVALTEPESSESVVLSGADATGLPDPARITELAQHGATMAVVLPAVRAAELVEALRDGGFEEHTPVVVAYKVSWPDELVVRTTLAELVATVKQHKLWRHTLFLVGGALRETGTWSDGQVASARAGDGARRPYRSADGATASARWAARARVTRRTSTSDVRGAVPDTGRPGRGAAREAVAGKPGVPVPAGKSDEEDPAVAHRTQDGTAEEQIPAEAVPASEPASAGPAKTAAKPAPVKASTVRRTSRARTAVTAEPEATTDATSGRVGSDGSEPASAEPVTAEPAANKAEPKASGPKASEPKSAPVTTAKTTAKSTGKTPSKATAKTTGKTPAKTTKTTAKTTAKSRSQSATRTQRGRRTS